MVLARSFAIFSLFTQPGLISFCTYLSIIKMDWKSWQLQFSKSVKLKTDSIWVKNKSVNIYQHIIYSSPTMSKKVIIGESFPESFGSFQLCFSQLASWLDFTLDFTQLQTWKLHEKKSPHRSMTGRPSNNTLARHWASLIRDSKNSTIRSMDCPNDKGLSESHVVFF